MIATPDVADLPTFGKWLQAKKNLMPRTAELYRVCVESLTRRMGHVPGPKEDDAVRMATLGMSDSGRKNLMVAYQHWVHFLTGRYRILRHKPRSRRVRPDYLTERQVKDLFALATHRPRLAAILAVLYYGGLRLTEATQLDWKHILWEEGGLVIQSGKGGDPDQVLVVPECMSLLAEYRAWEDGRRHVHPWMFCTRDGARLSPAGLRSLFQTLAERMGCRVTAHMLRHSIATHMIDRGAPLPIVQRHLRHKDAQITLVYYHFAKDSQRRAVQAYTPALWGRKANAIRKQMGKAEDADLALVYPLEDARRYLTGQTRDARIGFRN